MMLIPSFCHVSCFGKGEYFRKTGRRWPVHHLGAQWKGCPFNESHMGMEEVVNNKNLKHPF